MSFDLIPPKNASSKYLLTIYRLSFNTDIPAFRLSASYFKVRQMTWISNHSLMIMEKPPRFNEANLLKFLNFSAQTHGYIKISDQLLASFAIDKNLSRPHFENPILYTWINDSIYITSLTSTCRLTRQQMQFAISNQEQKTYWGFYWEYSTYLWKRRGAEGKPEQSNAGTYFQQTPFLISKVHIPKAPSRSSRSLTSVALVLSIELKLSTNWCCQFSALLFFKSYTIMT